MPWQPDPKHSDSNLRVDERWIVSDTFRGTGPGSGTARLTFLSFRTPQEPEHASFLAQPARAATAVKVEFELDTQAGCRDSVEREDETRLKLESRVTNDLDEFDRRLDLYSSEEEAAYQLRLALSRQSTAQAPIKGQPCFVCSPDGGQSQSDLSMQHGEGDVPIAVGSVLLSQSQRS